MANGLFGSYWGKEIERKALMIAIIRVANEKGLAAIDISNISNLEYGNVVKILGGKVIPCGKNAEGLLKALKCSKRSLINKAKKLKRCDLNTELTTSIKNRRRYPTENRLNEWNKCNMQIEEKSRSLLNFVNIYYNGCIDMFINELWHESLQDRKLLSISNLVLEAFHNGLVPITDWMVDIILRKSSINTVEEFVTKLSSISIYNRTKDWDIKDTKKAIKHIIYGYEVPFDIISRALSYYIAESGTSCISLSFESRIPEKTITNYAKERTLPCTEKTLDKILFVLRVTKKELIERAKNIWEEHIKEEMYASTNKNESTTK
jgi:hypothetical protein